MSHAVFWIEILVSSLLFTSLTIAISARLKGFGSWLACVPNAFVFFVLCVPVAGAAYLKYSLQLRQSYFAYATSLLAACIVGAIVAQRLGARRLAGMSRAATQWKTGQLAIGTLICLVVLVSTVWNMDLEVRHQSELTRARAGALFLSVAPPDVPDAQNAAVPYNRVFKSMAADRESGSLDIIFGHDPLPDANSAQVSQLLLSETQNLKLLRDAAHLPVCRFDHDYSAPSVGMLLPELNYCRSAAYLLKLDASHELMLGHTKAAMTDIDAMFAISRAAGQLPIVISGLVAIGIDTLAVNALESALPQVRNADEVAPLRTHEWEDPSRSMQRDMRGEEAFGLSAFADLGGGRLSLTTVRDFSQVGRSVGVIDRLGDLPFCLFLLDGDQRGYERLMEEYQEMMAEPYLQAAVRESSDEFMQIPREGIMTGIVFPSFNRICANSAKGNAEHNAALVGIAITRFRLDHLTLPDTLDALLPQYLPQIPIDPFDGQPLRFRKTADDWRVYSIGPDNHDDGGTPYDSKTHTGNISFVVKNH